MLQILQGTTVPVLKSLLSAMGRAVSGKKKELIARVRIPHPLSEPGAKRARINPSDEETTCTSTRSVDPPNIVEGACRSLRVLFCQFNMSKSVSNVTPGTTTATAWSVALVFFNLISYF